MPLIEAVPNISEGRNQDLLQNLQHLLQQFPHVKLLHTDSNPVANRTVFTLIGTEQSLPEALFHFINCATQAIDMRQHQGAHPRLGAVDVCPLVPLQDITLAQTAQLATRLGQRVGQELHIPVYLYEDAAQTFSRKNLAFIRRGEYEHLANKLAVLPPDFGPHVLDTHVQKTGACIIGARPFLIAFNINLDTRDEQTAKQIAARIRESNGGLQGVKAIGWYMENFGCAQVSCNIVDFEKAPLYTVFETCQQIAADTGVKVTGCELVGLIPLAALIAVGRYYAAQITDLHTLLRIAIQKLNLSDVKPFDPSQQILELKAGLPI